MIMNIVNNNPHLWSFWKQTKTINTFSFLCVDETPDRNEMNVMDQILEVNSSK